MGPSLAWKLPTETVNRESATQNKTSLPTEDSTGIFRRGSAHRCWLESSLPMHCMLSHFLGILTPNGSYVPEDTYFLSMNDSAALPTLHTYNLSTVKLVQCYFISCVPLFCGILKDTWSVNHMLFLLTLPHLDFIFQLSIHTTLVC